MRRIGRLQHRSWCLLLIVSVLSGRNYYGMPRLGCVIHGLFLPHFVLLLQKLQRPSLYDMEKALPLSQWSEKWQGRFYTIYLGNLLSVGYGRAGVTLKKSLIRGRQAGLGIVTSRPSRQSVVVGSYYSSLVNGNLCRQPQTTLLMVSGS